MNAFTVDLEDYFQVSGFENAISFEQWPSFESRVVDNTHRLLELLDETLATFYVLGWTAQQYPGLIREIIAAGHEIGSHTFSHRLIHTQSPKEFRDDLRRSLFTLEDISGSSILHFRAPSFSLTPAVSWAKEILVEEGIQYDSSEVPIRTVRGGGLGIPRRPYRYQTASGELIEFPIAVAKILGKEVPVSGGGYFRFFPYRWIKRCLGGINSMGIPFSFYIHPWEVDPHQPRIAGAGMANTFRHYVNLRRTQPRLRSLLRDFRFGTVSQALASTRVESSPMVGCHTC